MPAHDCWSRRFATAVLLEPLEMDLTSISGFSGPRGEPKLWGSSNLLHRGVRTLNTRVWSNRYVIRRNKIMTSQRQLEAN